MGYWKNRKVEKISPWLLSMLFISATVPFMGPTRMNTQVFVTVYYAFILGCVASLITLPSYEELDEGVIPDSEDEADVEEADVEEASEEIEEDE